MQAAQRKEDRRITRTKRAIKDALIALILEKHYDTIIVQDIIDRANIGRSTFYLHFRDKEDVLISDWKNFLGFFIEYLNWEDWDKKGFAPMGALYFHLKDFHHFYRALERSQKSERLFKTGSRFLAEELEKAIAGRFDASEVKVPIQLLATYLSNEIFGQMRWWLDNNMPLSPAEMEENFNRLVMPGIKNALTSTYHQAAKPLS